MGLFCKRDLQKRPIFCKETRVISCHLVCQIQYGVATISRLLKITGLFYKEPYKRVIPCHLVYQIQDGVATINRLLKIIGLFCKRALQKRPIFCKETYNCKEPTSRTHPTASWLLKIWFFSQSELSRVSLPQKSRLVSFFIKFKFLKSQFLSHGVHQRHQMYIISCTPWLKKVASWL